MHSKEIEETPSTTSTEFSGRDEVELRSRAVTDTEYGTIVKYSKKK